MNALDRITQDPQVMDGKPRIRGLRVTVGAVLGMLADGATWDQILADYPYLESDDIRAALAFSSHEKDEGE
jgi:uncharacterized protein (DUF433 family)